MQSEYYKCNLGQENQILFEIRNSAKGREIHKFFYLEHLVGLQALTTSFRINFFSVVRNRYEGKNVLKPATREFPMREKVNNSTPVTTTGL